VKIQGERVDGKKIREGNRCHRVRGGSSWGESKNLSLEGYKEVTR